MLYEIGISVLNAHAGPCHGSLVSSICRIPLSPTEPHCPSPIEKRKVSHCSPKTKLCKRILWPLALTNSTYKIPRGHPLLRQHFLPLGHPLYRIAQPRKLRKELKPGKNRKVLLLEHTTFEFARLLILPIESYRLSTRGTHPEPVLRAWLVQHLLLHNGKLAKIQQAFLLQL